MNAGPILGCGADFGHCFGATSEVTVVSARPAKGEHLSTIGSVCSPVREELKGLFQSMGISGCPGGAWTELALWLLVDYLTPETRNKL